MNEEKDREEEFEEFEDIDICSMLGGFLQYFESFEDKVTKLTAIFSWAIEVLAREIGEEEFADCFRKIVFDVLGDEEFQY